MTRAQVQASLGGGANVSGWRQAAFSQSVQLSAVDTSGWRSAKWEIYDYPPGFSAPAGWATDASGVIYFQSANYTTPPPSFTTPASGANNWGCFAIRLTINDNPPALNPDRTPNRAYNPNFVDESTVLYIPSPSAGMTGVAAGMTSQADALRQWPGALMADQRKVDAAISTAGGNALKGKTLNAALAAGQTYQGNGASIDAAGMRAIVNALAFGATAGASGNGAKLRSALASLPASGGTVYTPEGTFYLEKPVVISSNNVDFGGAGNGAWAGGQTTLLRCDPYIGPAIMVCPADLAMPLTTDPTFGGNAASFDGLGTYYVNLSDTQCGSINGLSQLTLEMWVTRVGSGDGTFMASSGALGTESAAQSFAAYVQTGNVGALLKTTGGLVNALYTAPAVGTPFLLEISYDGANVRVWINGAFQGASPLTGTISQKWFEDLAIGLGSGSFRASQTASHAPSCKIGSTRLSNTARRTTNASYTVPVAKFASDANTVLVVNWDSQDGPFTVGTSHTLGDRSVYLVSRRTAYSSQVQSVRIHDLSVYSPGSAIDTVCAPLTEIDGVNVVGCYRGIELTNNSYESIARRIQINGGTGCLLGLRFGGASGVFDVQGYVTQGTGVAFCADASGGEIRNMYAAGAGFKYGVMARDFNGYSTVDMQSVSVTDEGGDGGFVTAIFATGMSHFQVRGGSIQLINTAVASLVEVDGGIAGLLDCVMFAPNAATTQVLSFVSSNPTGKIKVDNCNFNIRSCAWVDGAHAYLIDGPVSGAQASRFSGTGSPNGAVAGNVGDSYQRLDGGAGTTLYIKESGAGTNTGWVAK